jgi:uncharacterized protein YbjT (DUF2867 family)
MESRMNNPAMTSPILVTGGTGTLGRLVVPLLRDADCNVRVLSQHSRISTAFVPRMRQPGASPSARSLRRRRARSPQAMV